ncbi:MAG: CbiX/SirB N-terminal domain-containing protein [Synechococcaceae cyanobacterium]|nr:CbiX/SirB N-terminal domain-containing protein [Synechococcaceae cyanobacterium]
MSGDPLHLVIHGRAGGEVPAAVRAFAAELARRRDAPVTLEALTAGAPPPSAGPPQSPGSAVTLVPLLLLPGRHVRRDVPEIRRRLSRQGVRVRSLPFLGAWPAWLNHLQGWVERLRQAGAAPLLVHHPLDDRLGERYLAMLGRRLQVPLVSAGAVGATAVSGSGGTPPGARTLLPLALAPNRMTAGLASGQCPHLLADCASRSFLLAHLARLP